MYSHYIEKLHKKISELKSKQLKLTFWKNTEDTCENYIPEAEGVAQKVTLLHTLYLTVTKRWYCYHHFEGPSVKSEASPRP